VFGGQEFSKPLRHVPAKRLVKFCFSLLRSRLPEVIVADLFGPQPYYYSPLVTGSKIVRVDALGTSLDALSPGPNLSAGRAGPPHVGAPMHEEFRHHGGSHYAPLSGTHAAYDPAAANAAARAAASAAAGTAASGVSLKGAKGKAAKALAKTDAKAQKASKKDAKAVEKAHAKANASCADRRQKMFGSLDKLATQAYDPNLVYTFEYYDSNFVAATLKADLGGLAKLDLAHCAGEQPVLIDSKLAGSARVRADRTFTVLSFCRCALFLGQPTRSCVCLYVCFSGQDIGHGRVLVQVRVMARAAAG
jgi:hypothetical protein